MYRVGPHEFTATDAERTFANLGELWRGYVHHLDVVPEDARTRALEVAARLTSATGGPQLDVTDAGADPGEVLDTAGAAANRCVASGTWNSEVATTELGAAWTGIRSVGDVLRDRRAIAVSGTGRVAQVNTSAGGVPKRPIDSVDVGYDGLAGDRQASRRHHGKPWQAVCLWGLEVIEAFAADGHPIGPGSTGENVTIVGLDWSDVRPGVRLRIGTVRCEISSYSLPCTKNTRWFVDGDHRLMHHTRGAVSRVYATVLEPGRIGTDDTVTIEP